MGIAIVLLIVSAVTMNYSIEAAICILILTSYFIYVKQLTKYFILFIVAFLFAVYFYAINDFKRSQLDFNHEENKQVKKTITFLDDYKIDGNLMMGSVNINGEDYQFFYKIGTPHELSTIKNNRVHYYQCSAHVTLQNAIPNTNFSGFNYDAYLYHQHKKGSVKLTDIHWSNCAKKALNIVEQIKDYRQTLIQKILKTTITDKGFFIALTLGDTTYLNKEQIEQLKTLGIYHLYAISGSHVALISVQLYYLLRRSHLPIVYCKSVLLLLLPFYMIFTGGQPSVFRATVFIMLILYNPFRHIHLTDIIALTFIINLLYDPYSIFDVGFQLSYIICFSFILILPLYQNFNLFYQFIIINSLSHFATLPILFYHFHNNYFIGLITNLIYIPLFTFLIFPLCTLVLLIIMNNIELTICNDLLNLSFQLNHFITSFFMGWPKFEWILMNQHFLMYVFIFILSMYLFSRIKKLKCFIILFILLLMILTQKDKDDEVHFLDVGQGDAFILELQNQVIMIDTGGKLDFSKGFEKRTNAQSITDKVTKPYLKYQGIGVIDYLILSHPDTDHFGETATLINEALVKNIILNKKAYGSDKYDSIIKLAHQKNINIIDVNTLIAQNKNIAMLHFFVSEGASNENDDSIVVFLKYPLPHRNILFLADLSKSYEDLVIEKINEPINIVKVGHHGSNTSTGEVLLSSGVKFAVISAGRNNLYHHPHEETINALKKAGINILNTQHDGRITINLSNNTISTQYSSLLKKQKIHQTND